MNLSQLKEICGRSKFWPLLYPRVYRDADRFGDPAAIACSGVMALDPTICEPTKNHAIGTVMRSLIERQVPTFFLEKRFLRAMLLTAPLTDLNWSEIHLPHEAAVICLPRGVLKHPKFGDIGTIAYARLRYPASISLPGQNINLSSDSFSVVAPLAETDGMPAMTRWIDQKLAPTIGNAIGRFDEGDEPDMLIELPDDISERFTRSDVEIMDVVMRVLFNVLLAITARPSLEKRGVRTGRHKKSNLPIWTPNIVGRDYTYRSERSGKSHGSKRMHWRRGHFRSQAYGAGRVEHRIIWIEPTLIGGENER